MTVVEGAGKDACVIQGIASHYAARPTGVSRTRRCVVRNEAQGVAQLQKGPPITPSEGGGLGAGHCSFLKVNEAILIQ